MLKANETHVERSSTAALALGALGVVFGDIGTSPLYAIQISLHAAAPGGALTTAVYGVLSLVFWAVTIVVSIKYVLFIMSAENKGEGGILALMAMGAQANPTPYAGAISFSPWRWSRGPVLRRLHHHPGHLGLVGGRRARGFGSVAVDHRRTALARHPRFAFRHSSARHQDHRATLRSRDGGLFHRHRRRRHVQILQNPVILAAMNPVFGLAFVSTIRASVF